MLLSLPLLALLGMVRGGVVECKDGDGEVRGCGEDLAGSGKNLIDDGLGLCGAHGEGKVSEGGERCSRSTAEPGDHGRV